MAEKRIEKLWDAYRTEVIPEAGEVQVEETKKAFYAGSYALMSILINTFDDEHEDPTEDDLVIMDDIHQELQDFAGKYETKQ